MERLDPLGVYEGRLIGRFFGVVALPSHAGICRYANFIVPLPPVCGQVVKYWLRNIARQGLSGCIILSCIGGIMWIISFFCNPIPYPALIASCVLTGLNATLLMFLFQRAGLTNMLSFFVPSSYWVLCSAVPVLHGCWQGQVIVLGLQLIGFLLLRIDYQHAPLEEAFLATLILCGLALLLPEMLIGIPLMWLYLRRRYVASWRVFAASVVGIAVFALYYAMACYWGWATISTGDFFIRSHLPIGLTMLQSLIAVAVIYLPVRRESVLGGVVYTMAMALAVAATGCAYLYPVITNS